MRPEVQRSITELRRAAFRLGEQLAISKALCDDAKRTVRDARSLRQAVVCKESPDDEAFYRQAWWLHLKIQQCAAEQARERALAMSSMTPEAPTKGKSVDPES